jgi:hypothetical protein
MRFSFRLPHSAEGGTPGGSVTLVALLALVFALAGLILLCAEWSDEEEEFESQYFLALMTAPPTVETIQIVPDRIHALPGTRLTLHVRGWGTVGGKQVAIDLEIAGTPLTWGPTSLGVFSATAADSTVVTVPTSDPDSITIVVEAPTVGGNAVADTAVIWVSPLSRLQNRSSGDVLAMTAGINTPPSFIALDVGLVGARSLAPGRGFGALLWSLRGTPACRDDHVFVMVGLAFPRRNLTPCEFTDAVTRTVDPPELMAFSVHRGALLEPADRLTVKKPLDTVAEPWSMAASDALALDLPPVPASGTSVKRRNTPALGTRKLPLRLRYNLPNPTTYVSQAQALVDATSDIFLRSRSGILLDVSNHDKSGLKSDGLTTADVNFNDDVCDHSVIRQQFGIATGAPGFHIVFVADVGPSGLPARSCLPTAGHAQVVVIEWSAREAGLLAHEMGHALGLRSPPMAYEGHTDNYVTFDNAGVMTVSGPLGGAIRYRDDFSVGQAFRMSFHADSWMNWWLQTGPSPPPSRTCGAQDSWPINLGDCPRLHLGLIRVPPP